MAWHTSWERWFAWYPVRAFRRDHNGWGKRKLVWLVHVKRARMNGYQYWVRYVVD